MGTSNKKSWSRACGALVCAVVAGLSSACGADRPSGFRPADSASLADAASSEGGGDPDAGGYQPDAIPIRNDAATDDCSEAARLVYVLSDDNVLYSFRPNRREFTRIGALNCDTDMQPNSMSIDRNAVAWVNYVDGDDLGDYAGEVFRVSTQTARCTDTRGLSLPDGWLRLGMGFSSDAADSSAETLFIAATADPFTGQSAGLAAVDPVSLRLSRVGSFRGLFAGESAELTGTGDGRLFAFFTTRPVHVVEIDKDNAATLSDRALPQVETPAAWAFAFWGGDFYLFTAPSALSEPRRTTNVTRYRPSDGSVDPAYMTNIGFRVVGAGVSTCAPIEPPG